MITSEKKKRPPLQAQYKSLQTLFYAFIPFFNKDRIRPAIPFSNLLSNTTAYHKHISMALLALMAAWYFTARINQKLLN